MDDLKKKQLDERIARFETMVRPEADPNNDMAWFSLGTAYAESGRHQDAAHAYNRCIALNEGMSKAYQLAGKAYMDAGELSKASDVLRRGYTVASRRGDLMPQKAMADLLKKMGEEPPVIEAKADQLPEGTFICRRSGRPGHQLPKPPFKGAVGQWIFENISKETFDAWIGQGTKVINELRLDLSREQDGETYDRHMREYLGIDDDLYRRLTGESPAASA